MRFLRLWLINMMSFSTMMLLLTGIVEFVRYLINIEHPMLFVRTLLAVSFVVGFLMTIHSKDTIT